MLACALDAWHLQHLDLTDPKRHDKTQLTMRIRYLGMSMRGSCKYHGQRDLPRALVVGCAVVTLIYVLLNTVFLTSAATADLSGEVEIAYIVADEVLGPEGAFIVSLLLSGILISTVSAMVMAGPRALQRLGEDYVFAETDAPGV